MVVNLATLVASALISPITSPEPRPDRIARDPSPTHFFAAWRVAHISRVLPTNIPQAQKRNTRVPHFSRSLREVGPFSMFICHRFPNRLPRKVLRWTGGPPFPLLLLNSSPIRKVGAPSLRFLQGWAAMPHAPLDWLRRDKDQQTCASISDSHPSRRMGHPSVLAMPTRSKSLRHPPPLCVGNADEFKKPEPPAW